MTRKILVVAPHPDDETLGCGGTLLRYAAQGMQLAWLIVTDMTAEFGAEQRAERSATIAKVAKAYGFDEIFNLGLPTTAVDMVPRGDLVREIGAVFRDFEPDTVLLPHAGDVHSDHRLVFDACATCTKWFRFPFIQRALSYETLSETDAALPSTGRAFEPNVFFDITSELERKLEIIALYASECGVFPFPRSREALSALARLRGAQSGYQAAEAFMLLRERNP